MWLILFLWLLLLQFCATEEQAGVKYDKKIVKGNKNALYLVSNGVKSQFPDFWTFTSMGYAAKDVIKIPDDELDAIPLGDTIKAIPVFRPDDYFYHEYCDDAFRIVHDVGVVPSLGNIYRHSNVMKRIKKTNHMDIVALGGSITAGGYFEEFVRLLRTNDNYDIVVHNHGHGATEITYSIFCVDIDRYKPDVVLIDFSVNDYGHPKLMEALIRKVLSMESQPIVVLVNLWVHNNCPTSRYLAHAYYYQLPLINICPAVNLCYGKKRMPSWKYEEYSKTDGVHPWGSKGVMFIGNILYGWWKRYDNIMANENLSILDIDSSSYTSTLPPPLYKANAIGKCTRCDALVADADAVLTPVDPPKGFEIVTRVKVGYGGFNPADKNSSTKSFKKSWQAEKAGSTISFQFYGSSVRVAMWQRRDGMGVLHAIVDGNTNNIAKASGFFKGFTWAMDRNNTGRSEIIPLFEGLEDKLHTIKFIVSDEPANPWVKGHTCQIFALLSASDNPQCKTQLK